MFRKQTKNNSPQIDNTVAKSINFEVSIVDLARRSEKRAWIVAFCSMLISLILVCTYFYMLPLRKDVPYLVMADAYTGTATVAELRGDFSKHSITQNEAINRSNVAHYIMARESYDFALMELGDYWKRVYAMSSPDISRLYDAYHNARNPEAPRNVYGRERAIRVKILSIQLKSPEATGGRQMATVRFQRSIYDKKTGESKALDSKIATLEYTYKSNLAMDEPVRIINPLGFQVVEYRVDNDFAAPPQTFEVQAQPGQGMPANMQQYPGQQMPGQPMQGQFQGQAMPGQPMPGQGMPGQQMPADPNQMQGGMAPGTQYPTPAGGMPQQQVPVSPTGQPMQPQQAPAGQAPNQVNGVRN